MLPRFWSTLVRPWSDQAVYPFACTTASHCGVGRGLIQQLSNQIQHYHECSGGGMLLSFGRFQHDTTKQNEQTTFLNGNRMRHCGPCFLAIVAKVVAQYVY